MEFHRAGAPPSPTCAANSAPCSSMAIWPPKAHPHGHPPGVLARREAYRSAQIRVDEILFFRFEDGQIVEVWQVSDEHAERQQLKASDETDGGRATEDGGYELRPYALLS